MFGRERPTLADLRSRVYKPQPREIGNWLAIHWGRPAAIYGTWLAIRLGTSAHQITSAAVLAALAGAVAIGTGDRWGFVVGSALLHLAFWLDHVDGQVARWRGSASLGGVYFDYLMHHLWALVVGFACGHGLAIQTGEPAWSIAGFAIGAGWLGLGLHNDCKYKAIFERLINAERGHRIDPRPEPLISISISPLRSKIGWTWPAYKICEPHMVLSAFTVWSAVAIASPDLWRSGGMIAVAGMAILAPVLAIGRIARAIRRGAIEQEFQRWLRIDDAEDRQGSSATDPSPMPIPTRSASEESSMVWSPRGQDRG